MSRPSYPRINCCVKGCTRGTTTVEPGVRIICGKCWRRAPKALRDRASRWQRRARRFDRDGQWDRAELCARRADIAFESIRAMLSGDHAGEVSDQIPPLMVEELRKAGLA